MSALAIQVKDLMTALKIAQESNEAAQAAAKLSEEERQELENRLAKLTEEKDEIEKKLAEKEEAEEGEKEKEEEQEKETAKAKADLEAARAEVTKLSALLASGIPPPVGEGTGIPTGTAEQSPTLTKAEFKALSPSAQNHFYRNGGKLTD